MFVKMVPSTLFIFAFVSLCSCQHKIVLSSGQTKYLVSHRTRTKRYSSYNAKPMNNRKHYGITPTQTTYPSGTDMKKWRTSYSQPIQTNQLQNYKGFVKPKVLYRAEILKTKPSQYRLRSIGRTLIEEYIQNYLPWNDCISILTNLINFLFSPTSEFAIVFINAGVDQWCGNKLYKIFDPAISPFTDEIFEKLHISRD